MNNQTQYFSFIHNGIENLERELSQPFTQISLVYPNKSFLIEKNRWVSSVTLWNEEKYGLRISSTMNNVADRTEVGSLCFKQVDIQHTDEVIYSLPKSFSEGTRIQKLIIVESGCQVESGIQIEAGNDDSLVVVPNATPFSLAISSSNIDVSFFEPEYDLEEYQLKLVDSYPL